MPKKIIVMVFALLLLCAFAYAQEIDWTARFDGAGGANDIALSMETDSAGNVYIAGYSYDQIGNDNVRLVKFSSTGTQLWTRTFNGGHGWDDARDIAIGPDDSVTLVGFTTTETSQNVLVMQYLSNGTLNWRAQWSGPNRDDGKAVAIDDAGYVYIAAESDGPDLSDDIVVLRYTPGGVLDWEQRYAGSGGWNDVATDIAVTPAGVATITGTARDTSFDLVVLQYDPDGTPRWVDKYDPLGYSYELGMGVALDDSGRAYVTGVALNASGNNDIVTICYETDGTRAWLQTFDNDPDTYDDAKSIAVKAGIVAVTGCSTVDTNDPDVRVIAYDTNGNQLWTDQYSGPRIRGDDCGEKVRVHTDGSVAVGGTSLGLTTEDDIVALRYSSTGTRQWVARYDGPASGDDLGTGVAFTSDGSVIVSGVSPDQSVDFVAVKYSGTSGSGGCGSDSGKQLPLMLGIAGIFGLGLRGRKN